MLAPLFTLRSFWS